MDTPARPAATSKVQAKPQNHAKDEEKKTLAQKISDFIRKNRTVLLAILGAVVLVLVVIASYSIISNARSEASAHGMEQVRIKLESWNAETDEAKKTELETAVIADLDLVAKKWPRSFAAQQALFTKGLLAQKKLDWAGAEKSFIDAANRLPKTYLAPVALEAAAVAAEEQKNSDKAIEYYTRIVNTYKEVTVGLTHAIFSLGRLSEAKEDWTAAIGHYETLVSSYPDAEWTKLAKDRAIFLKASGKGQ
jgi:TolA-binding protein